MSELQKYTPAQIAQIQDIKKLSHVKSVADAAAIFYKAQDATLEASQAQEIKLRCIRQAGFVLLPKTQGGMTEREERKGAGRPTEIGSSEVIQLTPYQRALEDAGISHNTGNIWQQVARVPEDKFEAYLAEADYYQDEITIAGLMKFAGSWYGRSDITEWETPQWLFGLLDDEFHFDLDVCASPDNTKCPQYYTKEDDAFQQDWQGVCWMNPPYGREIKEWLAKARRSAEDGALMVCLVPARPDTEWWWDNCIEGEIRFIKGRIIFENATSNAPFPCAVVILDPKRLLVGGVVKWWDVQRKIGVR